MEVYRPRRANDADLVKFHSEDYIDFLKRVTPENVNQFAKQLQRFNVGEDCPVFDGLYEYCQIYTGGSIDGAMKLNAEQSDIAVNWSGGLHHAKKCEASGFCYVNDIVLAILELLKFHARVLYIDIDVHHGDGVEEAFYVTDRVMTLSFHKYGDFFFPGTGDVNDVGELRGKYYAVNFPLKDGITDEMYEFVFKPVVRAAMDMYDPKAVVLQCGADSLNSDRIGEFNLSLRGHAECVRFVKGFNLPMLVVGGGGYNIRNVARCWTYETSVLLDTPISDDLPFNDYWHYFGPEFKLDVPPKNMENLNEYPDLERLKAKVLENMRRLDGAPSVQMHDMPPSNYLSDEDEDDEDPDERNPQSVMDRTIEKEGELMDGELDHEHDDGASEMDE